MRFAPTEEQEDFARSLDELLRAADVPALARAWADGKHEPGMALWRHLAELGVTALRIPETAGGLDATAVDTVIAFERLGYHLVPGPCVESIVLAPALLSTVASDRASDQLAALAAGKAMVTIAAPPDTPYALDADIATDAMLLMDGQLHRAIVESAHQSVDATRRLYSVTEGELLGTATNSATALDAATLASAAQLLGAGERLLAESVSYARSRTQFGHPIGEYQALKHAMADVRVDLDFARPLVHRAALSADTATETAARDTSAAKVAVAGAAYRAARVALQTHGAIGYTLEYDLGLWIAKVQALIGAWGTPEKHRARVLSTLVSGS